MFSCFSVLSEQTRREHLSEHEREEDKLLTPHPVSPTRAQLGHVYDIPKRTTRFPLHPSTGSWARDGE